MMTPSAKGPKTRTVDLVTGKAKVEYFFDPSLVLPPDSDGFDTPAKPSVAMPRTPSIKRKPSELSPDHPSADDGVLFSSKHLFMPCTVVKDIDSAASPPTSSSSSSCSSSATAGDGTPKKDHKPSPDDPVPALVKTSDGQLHKISDRRKLTPLTSPEDYLGIPDVLHLPNVTEASLLHTLRLRYHSDEIYTGAGPILMSVNPYKTMTVPGTPGDDLYSEDRMMMYRGSTANFVGAASGNGALAAMVSMAAPAGGKALPCHLFQVADRAYTSLLSSVVTEEVEPHLEEEDPMVMMEKDHEQKRRNHVVRNQSVIISGESGAGKTEATKKIMQYLARITAKGKAAAPGGGGGRIASAKEKAEPPAPDDAGDDDVVADADAAAAADVARTTHTSLEDRVLSSNPLLESFGNARTLKNDNSSRFGKFIKISFNTETGTIVGASISNYLLEKTRITTQIEGERNYHIFYQIFSGAEEDVLAKYGLDRGIASFRYLGNRATLKSRRDASAFVETMACLDQIGVSEEDKNEVLGIIAAVLHLGNIDFELVKAEGGNSNENARMTDSSAESLEMACSLLGLEQSKVSEAMLTKLLTIGGKTIHKPQDVAQASDKRDAFAKLVYSSLFLWMVNKINATLSEDSDPVVPPSPGAEQFSPPPRVHKPSVPTGFIGVLDIYGFENFENNGFEQLLINYANEKLQRHFNRHLFEVEQNLYSSEGVDWTYITFNDNRPCLELIEGGGGSVGILSTLDDCGGMGSASERDVNFLAQINQKFGGKGVSHMNGKKGKKKKTPGSPGKEPERHPNFITPKFGNDRQFVVVHYAGEVRYTVTGFVEKNVETLSNELKDLGSTSSKMFALGVFAASSSPSTSSDPTATPGSARRSTIRGVSVASQFRLSLQMLVMDLECTQPHYVRCIKPNTTKSPNSFDSGEVLRQLRYAGMMETIRIRREGYALREEHESFYRRFHLLLSSTEANQGEGITHLVKVLSQRLQLTDAEWQIGHSKIFLKRDLATKLELLAHLRVRAAGRIVVDFGRKVARTRASNLLTAWGKLQVHLIRKRRQIKASNKISATYRMRLHRRVYKSTLMSVVRIQCLGRRIVACERVRRERDPYWDKTFNELDILHNEMVSQMDDAVNAKDFKTAADLEKKLALLKEALESKRPLTRSVLESRIAEVQAQLDDAVARKAFQECAPLQEKLEELVKKREDLPTLDELKDAVYHAEKDVADAAARRDFAAAASLQAALDNAKQRLEDACRAEKGASEKESSTDDENAEHGFECRADLETAIAEASANIEEAISKRQFDKATTFQAELDRLENLRPLLPSMEEIKLKLENLKAEMDEAIKSKKFREAELIHLEVDKLEEKLKEEKSKMPSTQNGTAKEQSLPHFVNENGEKITFESRFNLEKEINRFVSLVQNAASSKNFKEASRCQRFLDQLEELKPLLPTAQELVERLDKVKKDMDEAIESKNFEKAEELHTIMEKLEKQVDVEKANVKAPEPVAVSKPIIATSVKPPVKASIKVSPDAASVATVPSIATKLKTKKSAKIIDNRPVSKLRPKAPMIFQSSDSVLTVAQVLANKRGEAAIITDNSGGLAGIITDTDVTRRVVAKRLPPSTTRVSDVMTANPTCVSSSNSAMDALVTMVENHFRHLPVTDDNGAVVGVLDIAKCLNDAITKLERSKDKSSSAAEDAVKQMASLQGAGGVQALALQQLLGPLLSQAFGGQSSPTLRTILAGKLSTITSPTTNLQEVGSMMAEARKAALVVEGGRLVGIFGFKDMMTRAIAKELPLELTAVSSVMTPNPESVSPDTTVLEALQIMHDNKFLTLPVCEDNGRVLGVVDVMDCVYASGGADGWRSIFANAMECDDITETASVNSHRSAANRSIKSSKSARRKDERPVSKLRPKKPFLSNISDSILVVSKMLASKRGDASIVLNEYGDLAGIITDTDVTRRVVAKQLPASTTCVSDVMTPNPTCVSVSDSAMDALVTMVENRFRHLPVTDENGSIVGCLDIAKCLNDAISKLERAQEKGGIVVDDTLKNLQSAGGNQQAAALQMLLGPLLARALGGKSSPTLRSVLAGKPSTIVSPKSTLQTVGLMMAEARKAALIVEDNELVGIFGFKDMMTRVIAKELPLDTTSVSEVMTRNPDSVSPETTVLEALQIMHDNRFLTLPVCEENGLVVGLVDVMDCVYASGGADGWKSLFDSALDQDDQSSVCSAEEASVQQPIVMVTSHPNNIPLHVEVGNGLSDDHESVGESLTHAPHGTMSAVGSPKVSRKAINVEDLVAFKVVDGAGHTYVIRAEQTIASIINALEGKVSDLDPAVTIFKYFDDEGDEILVTSDDCLEEAVRASAHTGNKAVKLSMTTRRKSSTSDQSLIIAGGVGLLAAIGIVIMVLLKPKK